jgi:hypothetical protein
LTEAIRLSAEQIELVKKLWSELVPEFDVALAIGVGISTFRRLRRRQLKALPRRGHVSRDSGRRSVDPTPEEIKQRCAEVQTGWDPMERIGRTSNVVGIDSTMVKVGDIREAIRNR